MTKEQPIVFIIDDDAAVRETIEDLLRSVGLEVASFGSTQEFLQCKRPDVPSCIVLDVRLPGASGLEFQNALIQRGVHLPIIFISGHGNIPMSVRAMKSGAVEFLTKPLQEQSLLDAVQAGIQRDLARREEAAFVSELRERFDSLTTREREVMALVVTGREFNEIRKAADICTVSSLVTDPAFAPFYSQNFLNLVFMQSLRRSLRDAECLNTSRRNR